jgi:uncharacterized membrane protein YdjX (TVP38/TMEM64 family)
MPKTSQHRARRWALVAVVGLVVVMLALLAAWHWTPLQDYAEPRHIAHWLDAKAESPWMLPLVAVIYVAASLVVFPNTVLCLAVIMALGPVAGTAYAYGGSLAAALTGYVIGRRGGKQVAKLHFRGFERVSAELRDGGFPQVLLLRLLPIAPFTATNMLSGAARVRLLPFVAATLIGISPYILAFAAFGRQARRLLSEPTLMDAAVAAVVLLLAGFLLWQAHMRASARAG